MTNLLAHAKPPLQHQKRSEEEEISDLHFPPKREIFFLQILCIGQCDRKPWRRRLSEPKQRRRRRGRETWDEHRKEQNALQDDQRRARRSCHAEQPPRPPPTTVIKFFLVSRRNCFFGLSLSPNRAILLVKKLKISTYLVSKFLCLNSGLKRTLGSLPLPNALSINPINK